MNAELDFDAAVLHLQLVANMVSAKEVTKRMHFSWHHCHEVTANQESTGVVRLTQFDRAGV